MAPDCTPFEQQLIEGCRKGNPKMQEMLYKHFYGFAMGIVLRYTDSRDEAASIVNDGFLKVFERVGRYTFESTFRGWMRRLMVNTALDYYRRNLKHTRLVDLEHPDSQSLETGGSVISQLTADDILKLLALLPPQYRMVFNLYEIEGFTHEEIARQLNLSVSTSRVYLARAKEQLGQYVKKHLPDYNERFWT